MYKKTLYLVPLLMAVLLSACSSGSTGSDDTNESIPTPNKNPEALTIDYTGDVPIINGSISPAGFYIHNNSDEAINNIRYLNSNNFNLEPDNSISKKCTNIAAHGACFIPVQLPSVQESFKAGTATLTAYYNDANSKPQQTSSMTRFNTIANNSDGLHFSSATIVKGHGNDYGYAVAYIYATGAPGTTYRINKISSKKGTLTVLGGQPDTLLAGSSVQIEIKAPTNVMDNYSDQLILNYSQLDSHDLQKSGTYKVAMNNLKQAKTISFQQKNINKTAHAMVEVLADQSQGFAYVLSSMNNMVNLKRSPGEQKVFFNNAGTQTVELGALIPSSSAITIIKNNCIGTLAPDALCEIRYNIKDQDTSGQAVFQLKYWAKDQAVATAASLVAWYSDDSVSVMLQPGYQNYILSNSNIESINYIVTNLSFESVALGQVKTTTIQGAANVNIKNDLCSNHILGDFNSSCSFTIELSQKTQELHNTGLININVDATPLIMAKKLNLKAVIQYLVTSGSGQLMARILPTDHIIVSTSNNMYKESRTMLYTNIGDNKITNLTGRMMNTLPDFTKILTNTCTKNNNSLNSGESCELIYEFTKANKRLADESGIIKYFLQGTTAKSNNVGTQANIFYQIAGKNTTISANYVFYFSTAKGRETLYTSSIDSGALTAIESLNLEIKILDSLYSAADVQSIIINDGETINPWIWSVAKKWQQKPDGWVKSYRNNLSELETQLPFTTTEYLDSSTAKPEGRVIMKNGKILWLELIPNSSIMAAPYPISIYQPVISAHMSVLNSGTAKASLQVTFTANYPEFSAFPINVSGIISNNITFNPHSSNHLMPGVQKDNKCDISIRPDDTLVQHCLLQPAAPNETTATATVIYPINPIMVAGGSQVSMKFIAHNLRRNMWIGNASRFSQIQIESMPLP